MPRIQRPSDFDRNGLIVFQELVTTVNKISDSLTVSGNSTTKNKVDFSSIKSWIKENQAFTSTVLMKSIRHTLGRKPLFVFITMRTAGSVMVVGYDQYRVSLLPTATTCKCDILLV